MYLFHQVLAQADVAGILTREIAVFIVVITTTGFVPVAGTAKLFVAVFKFWRAEFFTQVGLVAIGAAKFIMQFLAQIFCGRRDFLLGRHVELAGFICR